MSRKSNARACPPEAHCDQPSGVIALGVANANLLRIAEEARVKYAADSGMMNKSLGDGVARSCSGGSCEDSLSAGGLSSSQHSSGGRILPKMPRRAFSFVISASWRAIAAPAIMSLNPDRYFVANRPPCQREHQGMLKSRSRNVLSTITTGGSGRSACRAAAGTDVGHPHRRVRRRLDQNDRKPPGGANRVGQPGGSPAGTGIPRIPHCSRKSWIRCCVPPYSGVV